MRNIKAQLRTQYFGIPIEGVEQELISRTELDQIDKKQGHISEKSYYTDEYLELIKMHLPMFKDFGQNVQFVLENSEAYTSPEMGYADRKWRMEDLIGNENKEKKISHIVISHCGQEAGAYEVKKKLNKILPDCQIHIVETGGIASVYAGIGGIILAYA